MKDAKILKASKYSDDEKPNLAVVYEVKTKLVKRYYSKRSILESFEGYQDSKMLKDIYIQATLTTVNYMKNIEKIKIMKLTKVVQ